MSISHVFRLLALSAIAALLLGATGTLAGCGGEGKELDEVTSGASADDGSRERGLVPGGASITEADIEAAKKKADELENERGG